MWRSLNATRTSSLVQLSVCFLVVRSYLFIIVIQWNWKLNTVQSGTRDIDRDASFISAKEQYQSNLDCHFHSSSVLLTEDHLKRIYKKIIILYSWLSISRTRIYRILRNSKCLSESKIHFDCFLQPVNDIGDIFTSPNYPTCKLIWTCKK